MMDMVVNLRNDGRRSMRPRQGRANDAGGWLRCAFAARQPLEKKLHAHTLFVTMWMTLPRKGMMHYILHTL